MTTINEEFVKDVLDHLDDWFENEEQFQLARMTKKYYPYNELFSPIQVNRLRIKNRIVMGPMGNIDMAEEMGRPNDKMVQYFAERARGGVGLLTSGLIPIGHAGDPTLTEKGEMTYFPRITGSRTIFSGWRDLAQNVHAYGARFFVQLTPGLGRVGNPEALLKKYKFPVSASWNPNFYIPAIPCRPLTDGECRKIIEAAGQASADTKAMTLDGVYLHGHEGYLLEQMTNPAFNRRKLGRYANWQNFGLDMVKEIRKRVGPNFPIMYRIDLSLALNATYGERMNTVSSLKNFRNERKVVETLEYMVNLVKAGVDLFDVDLGCYDNWWLPHPPNSLPSGLFLPVAKLVKDYFAENKIVSNAGFPVPITAVGKLGYPDLAEKALRDGMCDMIMLARPLLADPNWANKAYAGNVEDICPCIGDQEACINEFVEGGHPQCSVNPRTGLEDVIDRDLTPAEHAKKIAVVGAGPSGIMAALTAARRGHKVTLFEQRERLGGWLVPGSVPKTKYEVGNYLRYLEFQVEKCRKDHDLKVKTNTTVTPEMLKKEGFDTVIIAAGATPVKLPVDGANLPHVVQAVDLLMHPEWAEKAQDVVVIGGGAVGCETAHWLASEYGKKITVVEMLPFIMKGLCTANRGHMIHDLEARGAKLYNCTRLKSIREGEVTVSRNQSKTVPDAYVTWTPLLPENIPNPLAKPIVDESQDVTLKADMVVFAAGLRPNLSFFETCQALNVASEVLCIGDTFQIGRVFEAVKAGFNVGRTI